MWQTVRKQTRPNIDVPFFNMRTTLVSDDFKLYWRDTFVSTDKLVYMHSDMSEDQLENTITMIWNSRESVDEMLADPRVQAELLAVKQAYLEETGITEIIVSNQEV